MQQKPMYVIIAVLAALVAALAGSLVTVVEGEAHRGLQDRCDDLRRRPDTHSWGHGLPGRGGLVSDVEAIRGGARAEDPAALKVFAEVRQQRVRLSRLMNAHDAARLVLGLLYLSRTAHAAPGAGVPTWSWLLGKAAEGSSPIAPSVSTCLAHWLPATDTGGDDTGTRNLMPVPSPGTDDPLRGLILAINSVQQVGTLLDQCLHDLSAEQARGSHYFTPGDMARLMVGSAAPQDGHSVLDPVCGSGGLLVESHRYVRERVGLNPTMSLRGKDQHAHTSQVARMNLAVRGIEAHVFPPTDSLATPEPDRYDIVLANLPFNQHDWAPDGEGVRQDRHIPTDPRWPEEPRPGDRPTPRGSCTSRTRWVRKAGQPS